MTTLARAKSSQGNAIDDWEAANYELDRRFLAALAKKDVDAAMSCFLDSFDLAVVLWGTEMRGPEPVRAAITRLFGEYDEVKLNIDKVTEFPAGDAVIAVGQATYSLLKAGKVTIMAEVWTDVRRKVNGRWVYVLDHAELLPAK
jgi:ketosteroid isomerase-like protein